MRKNVSKIWTEHNDEEFRMLVKQSVTYSDILRSYGFTNKGGNSITLKKRIKQLGIDTSHFKQSWELGYLIKHTTQPLEEILVEGSTYNRSHLKRRLIEEFILDETKCSICNCENVWNDSELKFILDHKNGVSDDNRIENLRLVCPNCNSQLPTHAGRNNKK